MQNRKGNNVLIYSLFGIICFLLSSCDSGTIPGNQFSKDDAEQVALRIVPNGRILFTKDTLYRQKYPAWTIAVQPGNAGVVTVLLHQETGELFQIEGIQPPFDYAVYPGLNLVPYEQARDTALSLREGSSCLHWILFRPHETLPWEYRFTTVQVDTLATIRWLVTIDAITGFPISIIPLP